VHVWSCNCIYSKILFISVWLNINYIFIVMVPLRLHEDALHYLVNLSKMSCRVACFFPFFFFFYFFCCYIKTLFTLHYLVNLSKMSRRVACFFPFFFYLFFFFFCCYMKTLFTIYGSDLIQPKPKCIGLDSIQ